MAQLGFELRQSDSRICAFNFYNTIFFNVKEVWEKLKIDLDGATDKQTLYD